MFSKCSRSFRALVAIAATFIASPVWAGPLMPPSGAIAPTFKTLTEIEPRTAISAINTSGDATSVCKITYPGSFYLTGNLVVPTGKNGIVIDSNDVTIDLNGFAVIGMPGSLAGIWDEGFLRHNIAVSNGTVKECGSDGISMRSCINSVVHDVRASNNGSAGIYTFTALVEDCVASENAVGFRSLGQCTFVDCIANENTATGFSGDSDIYESCRSSFNSAQGFNIGWTSTIRNCVANSNATQGIVCNSQCTIVGNHCRGNGVDCCAGIWVQGDLNHIESNNVIATAYGIYVSGPYNIIVRNTVFANSTGGAAFYILPNNHVGLITRPPQNAALINGSSGGGLGTTDPNANFVY